MGADDQVGEAVAVDVARRGDRAAAAVARRHAAELEAVAAVEARQVEVGGKARGLAEHHIARAGIAAVRVGAEGADDQVGEAVAVDVAGRGDREAAAVVRRHAAELEAVAAVEARQVEVGGKARGLAEHHIARAGIGAVRVGAVGADDQVGEAVAVDVAGRGDRAAAAVVRRHAAELEAVAAVEARQVEVGGKARGLAEHHIARAGIVAVRVGAAGADDQVGEAVAVDVARRGDRAAAAVVRRLAAELEAVACRRGSKDRGWRQSPRPCRTPHSSRRNWCRADRRCRRRRSGRRSRRR